MERQVDKKNLEIKEMVNIKCNQSQMLRGLGQKMKTEGNFLCFERQEGRGKRGAMRPLLGIKTSISDVNFISRSMLGERIK